MTIEYVHLTGCKPLPSKAKAARLRQWLHGAT